jgi:hypothetical protein
MTPSEVTKPKPDREDQSPKRRIGPEERRAIADYYEAGLRAGRTSDELLEHLSKIHRKSARQIQRYVAQVQSQAAAAEPRGDPEEGSAANVEGLRERHQAGLRRLLGQWQGEVSLVSAVDRFVFPLPNLVAPADWPPMGTPDGLMVILRNASWLRAEGAHGAVEDLYRRNRERFEPGPPAEVSLPAESDPLAPLLAEHLRDEPLPDMYRQWKEKLREYVERRAYWSGVVTTFALGRIVTGMRQGGTWDAAVKRLYTDAGLRREISGLLEPTAHLMSCHLLAMALVKTAVDSRGRSLAGALDVERTRAESRLEAVRSRHRIPPEVLFSEIYDAFREQPGSSEMALLWPLLSRSAAGVLEAASALDTLCAGLDREFGRLLPAGALPGHCTQCP